MGTPFSPKQVRNAMDAESVRKVNEYQNAREELIAAEETVGPNKVHLCIRNVVKEFSDKLGKLNDNQLKGNATNVLLRLTGNNILLKEQGEGARFSYRLSTVARPIDLTKIVTTEKAKAVFKRYVLDTGTADSEILPAKSKTKHQQGMAAAVKSKDAKAICKAARNIAAQVNTCVATTVAAQLASAGKFSSTATVEKTNEATVAKAAAAKPAAKAKVTPVKKALPVKAAPAKVAVKKPDLPDFL